MTTPRRHHIRYAIGGRIRTNPRLGRVTLFYLDDATDGRNWTPNTLLTKDQLDRAADLVQKTGGQFNSGQFSLPIGHAAALFAFAAECWGEPTDTDGYPIPDYPTTDQATVDEPPAEDATTMGENPAVHKAVRLIYDHGETLDRALRELIQAIRRERDGEFEQMRRSAAEGGGTAAFEKKIALLDQEAKAIEQLQTRIGDIQEALPEPHLWTLERAAYFLGASSTDSARKTLSRWGVRAVARESGRGGQSLYDAEQVRRERSSRPGQGARTDLRVG